MLKCSDTSLSVSGSEYQELQIAAVADPTELPESATVVADWHTTTEQPHGAVVAHAFPHASCLSIP